MSEKKAMVPVGKIEQRILLIRSEKVIVDADLSEFYGVPTKRLNEQVKPNRLQARERHLQTAFASYASADQDAVLVRVQGLCKALPGLNVFFARKDLRSGEKWQERLEHEIAMRDVMYLFWSQAAIISKWVDWEWRKGLETRGIDFINPFPLISPEVVPPPKELAGELHFGDWQLAYVRTSSQC